MKIGFGGKVGPFRAGISARGFGVGAGPVSTGKSFRRRKNDPDGWALLFGLVLVALFVAWPYMLGTWLAVELGAGRKSVVRSIAGWIPEVLWLAVLIAALVVTVVQKLKSAPK